MVRALRAPRVAAAVGQGEAAARAIVLCVPCDLFYAGGNYGIATRNTKSKSFAWQGYLWDERIIPTMGWRTDDLELAAYDVDDDLIGRERHLAELLDRGTVGFDGKQLALRRHDVQPCAVWGKAKARHKARRQGQLPPRAKRNHQKRGAKADAAIARKAHLTKSTDGDFGCGHVSHTAQPKKCRGAARQRERNVVHLMQVRRCHGQHAKHGRSFNQSDA